MSNWHALRDGVLAAALLAVARIEDLGIDAVRDRSRSAGLGAERDGELGRLSDTHTTRPAPRTASRMNLPRRGYAACMVSLPRRVARNGTPRVFESIEAVIPSGYAK
jgi:hypothetical protein